MSAAALPSGRSRSPPFRVGGPRVSARLVPYPGLLLLLLLAAVPLFPASRLHSGSDSSSGAARPSPSSPDSATPSLPTLDLLPLAALSAYSVSTLEPLHSSN